MPRFSERKGFRTVDTSIQTDTLRESTRTKIWNALIEMVWESKTFHTDSSSWRGQPSYAFARSFWADLRGQPLDRLPSNQDLVRSEFRKAIFHSDIHDVYDHIEFMLEFLDSDELNDRINAIFETDFVGYRYVAGNITDIIDKQEVALLENALADDDYPHVRSHLAAALEMMSDREKPDYRNSIKESISAVESMAKQVAGTTKGELGEALKALEKAGELHKALKTGFSALYGWSSDSNGIRHALMDEPNLTAHEARYFLVTCTAFVNYLKSKI